MYESDTATRFTVVVPAFNEVDYLAETLRSLQQQDFAGDYEIIVVDNNSTDGTAELARHCGVRVVLERQPGVCPARQAGTAQARGEIVVSTDADTRQPAGWLSRLDEQFADESVVLVGGPCRYDHQSWWSRQYPILLFGLVALVFRLTGRVFYVTATNSAFRRRSFDGYDTSMTQGGDELGLLRALRGRGRMIWDGRNVVTTSARRLQSGLLYSLVVTFGFYYVLGYAVNRLGLQTRVPMAPAFRSGGKVGATGRRARQRRAWRIGLPLGAFLVACLGLVGYAWPDQAVELARRLHP